MRTRTTKGRTWLSVIWKDEEGEKDTVHFVKIGRRVRVTADDVRHVEECLRGAAANWNPYYLYGEDDISKNVEVGPRTLATLLENTLIYGHDAKKVGSDYGSFGDGTDKLRFERAGQRVRFVAPCGQVGYLTLRDALALVDALRVL